MGFSLQKFSLSLIAVIAAAVFLLQSSLIDPNPYGAVEEPGSKTGFNSDENGTQRSERSSSIRSSQFNLEQLTLIESIVANLDIELSQETIFAIEQEAEGLYFNFFGELSLDEDQLTEAVSALSVAQRNRLLVAAAIDKGQLSEEELLQIRNPNYFLEIASIYLNAEQLTQFEEQLRAGSYQSFHEANASHLQIAAQNLDEESVNLVLEELFENTHARTNPHGIGFSSSPAWVAEQQLDAIAATRQSLISSLPSGQFRAVEVFLNEKEQALAATSILFGGAN